MANEQLIDEVVSQKAYEQVELLGKKLTELRLQIVGVYKDMAEGSNKILSSKNFKEINIELERQKKAQIELRIAEEKLAQVILKTAEIKAKQIDADNKRAEQLKKNTDKIIADAERERQAILKTEEARQKRKSVISESTAEDVARSTSSSTPDGPVNSAFTSYLKEVRKDFDDAKISEAEYVAELERYSDVLTKNVKKTGEQKDATNKQKEATKLSALEIEKETFRLKQKEIALKALAKEQTFDKGSIDQRAAALARLQKTYASLSATERNSPYGQRLGKVIPQLNEQVLTLEKSLGKSQRDVGNYGSRFANGASKAFGALKTVANILPGVGLAGLLAFAVDPILNYVKELDIFKTKVTQSKVAQEDMAKALAGSEYANAVKNVNELRINIDLAQKGFISKESVLKQYNETIGKTTGQVSSLDQAEQELNKNADAFIKVTLLKAAAQVALESAAKSSYEAEITRRKKLEEFSSSVENANFGTQGFGGTGQFNAAEYESDKKRRIKAQENRRKEEAKVSQDAADQQIAIAKKFQEDAAKISKGKGFTNFLGNDDKPKDNSKELEAAARKSAAARIESQIQANKEAQKGFADNDAYSYEYRLTQLDNFLKVQGNIIDLTAEKEIAGNKLTADEIKAIKEKANVDKLSLDKEYLDKSVEIMKQELSRSEKLELERNQRSITNLERLRDQELDALTKKYNDPSSLMSEQEFADKRREIEQKYTLDFIKMQIDQTDAFIKAAKLRGENVASSEAKLAALRIKYQDQVAANNKANSEEIIAQGEKDVAERTKQNEKLYESTKELAQESFDFGKSLVNASFENRLNKLQEEQNLNDKKRAADIENVNNSVATEEEKADKIAIINARADAQSQLIESRVREEKTKQAKADKAAAIAQAIINGALAMTKVSAQTGILSFAFSPLIAALTAIQVGTILATPIPKYRYGTPEGGHPADGNALVGDGFKRELQIDPDGSMSLTPDRPTITFLKKGTRIIGGDNMPSIPRLPKRDENIKVFNDAGIRNDLIKVEKAIKSITKTPVIVDNGISKIKKWASSKSLDTYNYKKL